MKIYVSRPISGRPAEEIVSWYNDMVQRLKDFKFEVLYPMVGKNEFRNDVEFREYDNVGSPITTNHAIYERDKWMTTEADVVYVDLTDSAMASIGCVMELAWASILGKHTVVVIPTENIHRHAFILEAADVVFSTSAEALEYLRVVSKRFS